MTVSPFSVVLDEAAEAIEGAAASLGYKTGSVRGAMGASKGFGDISCSAAFRISKSAGERPADIAAKIASRIGKCSLIEEAAAEGGYINMSVKRADFASLVLRSISEAAYGTGLSGIGNGKKVIIEYPSANPMHPIHVGHLRNLLLGDAVSNLHRLCGYDVEVEDYIDDLGLQMVIAVWGYMRHKEKPEGKFDHWLGMVYADANRMAPGEGFRDELSALAKRIENNGTEESRLARSIAERCVRAQYETAANYGSYHDVLIWESDILGGKLLGRAMDMLLERGVARRETEGKYNGCTIIDFNSIKDLPSEFGGLKESVKVLVRNDGTPTYVAKDIAFHMWKFGMLDDPFRYSKFIERQGNGKPLYSTSASGERMGFGNVYEAINIIDVKQSYPQSLLRLVFRQLGRGDIGNGIRHLAYGRVELEEGSLAARKGISEENTADGLLEEARERAYGLIGERLKLGEEEKGRVSEAVALSAIKFAFLKMSPEKWITFSWKWALSFEGDSGPYCQYMYARATRLLEDAPMPPKQDKVCKVYSDGEFGLVKEIAGIWEAVEKSCSELRPSVMAEYAGRLAYAFSSFYESTPILKDTSDDERNCRLALVGGFARAMKMALESLGIEALERM